VLYSKSLLIEVYKNNRSNTALMLSAIMRDVLVFPILVDRRGIALRSFFWGRTDGDEYVL
jgi:hypothetical protein